MPVLAGWLTGEQVPQEIIDQTLTAMGEVLGRYGGTLARNVQAGAGLITFADTAYALPQSSEPAVLDWVPDRRTLVYRRPLTGAHPLYFIENWPAEGNLLFASEVKALFAVGVPRRLHLPALAALARYGFIPAPLTIFKDVQVVPAGSILRWQRAKTVVNHSTDYRFDASPAPGDDPEQFLSQLQAACTSQLPTHTQLVTLASGSHASALATLLTAQQTTTPFTVASLGYTQSLDAQLWSDAQRVADACAHPFLAVIGVDEPDFWQSLLTTLEAPAVDTRSFALHQFLHTLAAETGARVAMSGLGAGLFFGSAVAGSAPLTSTTGTEPAAVLASYASAVTTGPVEQQARLWSHDVARALEQEEPWEETLHARKLARHAAQFTATRQRALYLDLHLRLPDAFVGPLQQLGTQASLLVRSPYLTSSITDQLLRLAVHGEAGETVLASLAQRFMPDAPLRPEKLPLAIATPSLTSIDNSDLLQQTLSPAALQATNLFAPDAVAALIQQARSKIVPRELLLVFTTQLLYQLFALEGF
ncbi:MAG: hypothetical protein NVS2B12_15330 [Ktedonobacteraceae bacterium]